MPTLIPIAVASRPDRRATDHPPNDVGRLAKVGFKPKHNLRRGPHFRCEDCFGPCDLWRHPHARQKRRFKRTTDSEHAWPIAPNLLEQDFTATRPDEKWGADISYVWTREGWLYLAVVVDLFSRRVVGWATADRLHRDLALSALRRALAIRCPSAGLIHHSDRGSQYCSFEYQALLRAHGVQISMSGKGNCYDNAVVETFFKTLKSELIWRSVFETRDEATAMIGGYIDRFYNPARRHSALAFMSPVQYEMMVTV